MYQPQTLASLHIMLALASQERHGYEIMKQAFADSQGVVKLGPATLYSNIKKLHELGLIEEASERPDPSLDDSRRKYYRLTSKGMSALGAEMERMNHLVRLGEEQKASRLVQPSWA